MRDFLIVKICSHSVVRSRSSGLWSPAGTRARSARSISPQRRSEGHGKATQGQPPDVHRRGGRRGRRDGSEPARAGAEPRPRQEAATRAIGSSRAIGSGSSSSRSATRSPGWTSRVMGNLGGRSFPGDAADIGPTVALPGGFRGRLRLPRFGRLHRVRVLLVHQARTRPSRPAAAPHRARQRRAEGGRHPHRRAGGDVARAGEPAGADRPGRHPRLQDGRHGRQPGEPDPRDARRLEGLRRAGEHGRRGVPRRGNQVLLPPGAGLVPLLRRPGASRARARAPDRLVHRQHGPQARALRARHDAHARRPRALPRSRRRAPVRRERLVRTPLRPEAADRLARQGRRPHHPAARARDEPVHADARCGPGFPLNGGTDVVYVGEGSIAKGYPVDPTPR